MTRHGLPLRERFMMKVNCDGPYHSAEMGRCWEWTASRNRKGYGQLNVDGVVITAHRVSYGLFAGEIPPGMWVLHKCDNPWCVRPEHLFLGTNADNVADKVRKGRQSHMRGTGHPLAKLTDDDIREIRMLRESGMTIVALGRMFGISHTAISRIYMRKIWKCVV